MKHPHIRLFAALLLTACLLVSAALADTVTVTASATVHQAADSAVVVIGASTSDATVQAASNENAVLLNAIISALTAQGISLDDMTTQDYTINPVYNYHYDDAGQGSSILVGYTVQNMLRITISDLSLVNTVIDTASAAGANECYGLTFSAADSSAAADQALTAAVEEGKRRAAIAAAAMGREIDAVIAVTEVNSAYTVYARDTEMATAKSADTQTPLFANEQTCTVTVEVTCSLK